MRLIKVLIADSNKEYADLLGNFFLNNPNFELVGFTSDGLETIKLIEDKNPDLLILDILMPSVGGLEVLQYLKKHNISKPVVFILTICNNANINLLARSLNARYIFIKPADFKLVIEKIKLFFEY